MCIPLDDRAMICWLETQKRVMKVWLEELVSRPDACPDQVARLSRHKAWLSEELDRLCQGGKAA